MAAYIDLYNVATNSQLRNRVAVANHILAMEIVTDAAPPANQTQRLKWATAVFSDPDGWATKMLRAIIADNAGLTVAQIEGATDAAIKDSADKVIDAFADLL